LAKKIGFNELRKFLGYEGMQDFVPLFNKLNKVWSGSSSALMTEYKNIQKRIKKFINQYQDAFLTPIQQFNKTSDLLERQLRRLKRQAKKGTITPEVEKDTLDTIEKLYKMSEQMMSIKVPASITASEAVRTGSKEAFDMVATNVFRDIYKVNVQQRDLQKRLVDVEEDILAMTQQSKGRLGIIGKGV
jgi:6-pyruvoyl-tetrahydropterin synthase